MSYDFDFGLFNIDDFLDESDEEANTDFPLLPLRDTVVFPHMMAPLTVGRDRSIKAVEAAMAGDHRIVVVAQRDPEVQERLSVAGGGAALELRQSRLLGERRRRDARAPEKQSQYDE